MNYMTSQEAAEKWGLTRRAVQLYCKSGKIPGAVNPGKQWLIPDTAEQPRDCRFAENRQAREAGVYHFPLLVYTAYVRSGAELSEDERALLEAQMLNLRCEFAESVRRCRSLMEGSRSPSVRFGAWFTNVTNFMFLGQTSQMMECIQTIGKLCESAAEHQEDYRLALAFFEHTYRFDASRYLTIDVEKLSPDAMAVYKIISVGVALFSDRELSESTIRFFEVGCRETELQGIAPASLTLHGMLAMLYARKEDPEAKLRHIDAVCRIGCENGLTRLLTKSASLDLDYYIRHLKKYDTAFATEVRNKCDRFRTLWQYAYQAHSGSNPAISASFFEHEIVLLLIFKTSVKEIAELKNIPEKEVRQTLKALYTRLNLNSQKELVEYFKANYSFSGGNQPEADSPAAGGR